MIIVCADTREFERYIIEEAHIHNVPSICFQWSLGPVSKRALSEQKSESLVLSKITLRDNILKYVYRLINIYASVFLRIFRLRTPAYAKCFGGGNSTVLAVIGKSSKEFYVSMGVNPKKIKVVGHALYEDMYLRSISNEIDVPAKRNEIYRFLKLPLDAQFVLFCTSYLKPGFYKYVSKRQIYLERERKIKVLLGLTDELYIIVKLHPRENLKQFSALTELSPKVRVLRDFDSNKLIPHCSLVLVRGVSTTALYGMLCGKCVITHNYPLLPGDYFGEIGGTVHVEDEKKLKYFVNAILRKDESILDLIEKRRNRFLKQYLNINLDLKYSTSKDVLSSIKNMDSITEELIARN